jgi:hypothetical protein
MYKILLEKGFKPIYYTNDDFLKVTRNKSRVSYRLEIREDNSLINVIYNTLNIYDKYFYTLQEKEAVYYIEFDEDLESAYLYIYNVDTGNYEIPESKWEDLLRILPNKFNFEHCDI